MKFERDEVSSEILFHVCSIRVFTKFSDDPYYEPLAWFMMCICTYTVLALFMKCVHCKQLLSNY